MKNKTLIILFTLLALLFISTATLATSDVKNAVSSKTDMMIDGVSNLAEDARNGVATIENTVEGSVNNLGNAVDSSQGYIADTNDDYTATRTDTTIGTNNTTPGNVWTWIALVIAGIVIVGLVWYYAYQTHDDNNI